MTNPSKTTDIQKVSQPQKNQPAPQGETYAPTLETAIALGFAPPSGPGSGDADPFENQADRLRDARFPKAQLHSFAKNINAKQGNHHLQRAVTHTIARQDDKKDKRVMKGIDLSMLEIAITKPITLSGSLSTKKIGEGQSGIVAVQAPKINFSARVDLSKDVELSKEGESFIKVGPIQTMTSSQRIGIYKKGNKEVAKYTNQFGQTRDSRRFKYNDDKPGEEGFPAERPFYDKPEGITNNDTYQFVTFEDKPTMTLPLEFGGGKLSRIEGADTFNTSIGLKRGGQISHCK